MELELNSWALTFLFIYFSIGIFFAFTFLHVIKNPPHYDLTADLLLKSLQSHPMVVGPILFILFATGWPLLFLHKD